MNEERKNTWLPIVGGVALIVVLFLTVKLLFAAIGAAVPPERLDPSLAQNQSQSLSEQQERETPAFCPFCGKELHDSFQWGQFCPWCGEKVEA